MNTYPLSLAILIAETASMCSRISEPTDVDTTMVIPNTAEAALSIIYHSRSTNWNNIRYWMVSDPTLTNAELKMLDTIYVNDVVTIADRTITYHLTKLSTAEFALLLKYQAFVFNDVLGTLFSSTFPANVQTLPAETKIAVNAKSLVDTYGEKLIDLVIGTNAMGEWTGGAARVTMVWPDKACPEIVMQVVNNNGEVGVFAEENVLVSVDWLKANAEPRA